MRTLALAMALLTLASPLSATEHPANWKTWVEQAGAPAHAAPIAFPDAATLGKLRENRKWLAKWAEPAPSFAWNELIGGLVVKYQQNPLRASRVYTYVHTAIHDALVVCAREGCDPKVRPVAMHAAASRMLEYLYPAETSGRLAALGLSAASASLASLGGHPQDALAWRAGRSVVESAIRRALDDGWDLPRLPETRPAWKPGVWRAAPPLNMYDPLEPNAARWRTWVLKDSTEIEPPPPPEYGSATYLKEVEEVRAVAAALTPEQKKIAETWNLDLGSVTPAGVWNLHAARLAKSRKLDAETTARIFATMNVATMDAFIACWNAKFKWWTERPITVIRERGDKAFTPHVLTPAFPSYVSGHAAASGAAAEVLAKFFPEDAAELRRMAAEAADSRLYGGIHFRSDNEAGLALGRAVAARALAR